MSRPADSEEPGGRATEPLSCPRCRALFDPSERFCPACGMPLVIDAPSEQPAESAGHERARKIRPQYAEGRLVKVGLARNLAEAELIQGLLLEEGVPSLLQRSRGFDVPDFLAAGPRDIMVPESARPLAAELLQTERDEAPIEDYGGAMARFGLGAAIALSAAALIVLALYLLTT